MAPLLGFIFAFSPPLPVCDPQASVSYSGKRKQKQLQIGALTHSDWGVGGMMATTKVCAKCLLRQRPEDSCNRVGCTCSGGSPSQWPQKQGLACEGYGYPTPCTPVKNDTSFPRQTTLPLGAFPPRRHSVFTPVLYPHGQKQSSSWICSLNPMLQHLSPSSIGRFLSQAGGSRTDSGGFVTGGAQDPRAYTGGGDHDLKC